MSYFNLLRMRCTILEQIENEGSGVVYSTWETIENGDDVKCFLDLNFLRAGRDPHWTPEEGTSENRHGVLFLPPGCTAQAGNRIKMIKGPSGTFLITSAIDEAWTLDKLHHLECHVEEINRALAE